MSRGFTGILHHLHLPADALDPSGRALLPLFFRIPADLIAFAGGRGGALSLPLLQKTPSVSDHTLLRLFSAVVVLSLSNL